MFSIFIKTAHNITNNITKSQAGILGRTENINCWMERMPDWDMNRTNDITNSSLSHVVTYYGGPKKLNCVKQCVKFGCDFTKLNSEGTSALYNACRSKDSDPETVEYLIEHMTKVRLEEIGLCLKDVSEAKRAKIVRSILSYRQFPRGFKWNLLHGIFRFLHFTGISRSNITTHFVQCRGATLLHEAVSRGDRELVQILLRHGADPTIKTERGSTPKEFSSRLYGPFPLIEKDLDEALTTV